MEISNPKPIFLQNANGKWIWSLTWRYKDGTEAHREESDEFDTYELVRKDFFDTEESIRAKMKS